jgi:putative redox protein
MTAQVKYLGDLRTEATHLLSGKKIITDAPPDNQGKGEAFSPTDLCATSLASCMLTIMGISARNHGMDIDGTEASVKKVMSSDPRRIGQIAIVFQMPAKDYSDKQKKILETAARNCPVHFSLGDGVEQSIEFVW